MPEISIRDILNTIFRHKWKIILFFISVVSTVTASTFRDVLFYESDAKLLIRAGRETVSIDPTVTGPTQYLEQKLEDAVNSEIAILSSPHVLERIVRKIGPYAYFDASNIKPYTRAAHNGNIQAADADEYVDPEIFKLDPETNRLLNTEELSTLIGNPEESLALIDGAVGAMSGSLTIGVEVKTYIVSLSYKDISPELAHETLKRLIIEAERRHIEIYKSIVDAEFFEQRAEELRNLLHTKEFELQEFRRQNGITELNDQIRYLIELGNSIEMQLGEVKGDVAASSARLKRLRVDVKKHKPMIEQQRVEGNTNHVRVEIRRQLLDLRLKETELAARYTDEARPLKEVREKIALAEAALAQEPYAENMVTMGINPTYERIYNDLLSEEANNVAQIAKRNALSIEAEKNKAELNRLSIFAVDLSRRLRDVDIAATEYRQYRENLQRAQTSDELDSRMASSIRIVQPATFSDMPLPSRSKLKIAMSIVLGLLGGLGLVFILEIIDDTVKNEDDVKRRLHLPVLASVPYQQYQYCLKRSIQAVQGTPPES